MACCRQAKLQDADRDDVFVEVFRRVWEKLGTFERRTSFRKWVYSIARTQIADLFRARKRDDMLLRGWLEENPCAGKNGRAPTDGDDWAGDEVKDALHLWVRQTRERNQDDIAFRAFYRTTVDGQSAADVAEEIGIKAAAVRQYKCRWMKRMREEMAELFGELLPSDLTERVGWPA